VAETLEIVAAAVADRGDPATGARLFAAASAIRKSHNAPRPPAHEPEIERDLAAIRTRLDPADFDAAWSDGGAMRAEEAVACGLKATAS
jgi:hypothetical protein